MKIAHLSDLHICAKHRPENIDRTERLIETAIAEGMDHLVITGDISHNAQPVDFYILRDLLKKYDLLRPEKLSVVIGNHDIYGGVHLATDILSFPQKCMSTNFEKRVQEFGRYFEETFAGTHRINPTNYFPYAKDLGETVIFGLNTNSHYARITNPLASNGKMNPEELNQLRKLFSDRRYRFKKKLVLMHHHIKYTKENGHESGNPFWHLVEKHTMKIHGVKKLVKLFSRYGIDFVFHGHIHNNGDYQQRHTRFFNAGGSLEYNIYKSTMLNLVSISAEAADYEIIKLEEDKIKVETFDYIDQLVPSFAS